MSKSTAAMTKSAKPPKPTDVRIGDALERIAQAMEQQAKSSSAIEEILVALTFRAGGSGASRRDERGRLVPHNLMVMTTNGDM